MPEPAALERTDDGPRVLPDDVDSVTYQFDVDRDLWREWADSIPRSTNLHTRLRRLIQLDTELALDDWDVTKLRLIEMKAERITERARQGQNAITKREKPHQAVEKLESIEELSLSMDLGCEE